MGQGLESEASAKLGRRAAGFLLGLGSLAVFATLLFVGDSWPRKRAARRVWAAGREVLALLPVSTSEGERAQLEQAFECTARAVWSNSLSKEEALPLVGACLEASRDGVLGPEEAKALTAQASSLCLRGGRRPRR